MRIDPPPSPPVASVTSPPATAAARAARRAADGAAVAPRVVRHAVELRDADVEPAELARGRQADGDRAAAVEQPLRRATSVYVGDAVLEHERRFGAGQPCDRLELLDAGRARRRTVARRRRRGRAPGRARRRRTRTRSGRVASIAASVASSSSTGERSPRAERVDERARVSGPRARRASGDDATGRLLAGLPPRGNGASLRWSSDEGGAMPMYLFRASYSPEGATGLIAEGGTAGAR